ncbi:DUF7619 domain-containing protein [Lacinutrix algicola]|uniref:DUF7619 domain-containing protein n=1 Tax=Lacinutrix algicola TaxID=342954 RepID=UPI0006E41755|nr:T9SS type A sorting domain-containing protein [Lacinutrix algicola]
MKNIKTIIHLILLFVSSFAFGQIVNIPDANFKAGLLNLPSSYFSTSDFVYVSGTSTQTYTQGTGSIDVNGDGEIQESEALLITGLSLGGFGIISLQGIDACINLEYLDLEQETSLNNLDLSSNIELEYLNVSGCVALNNLDVSSNLQLEHLDFNYSDGFSTIDLSNNSQLKYLNCEGNFSLQNLDLSNNLQLEYLNVNQNINLNTLDLSNNIELKELYGESLELITSLDLSNNLQLEYLYCPTGNINTLNLPNSSQLEYIDAQSNQLTTLNVSSNVNLRELYLRQNTQFSGVDLSSNVNLEILNLGANNVQTEIDLSLNPLINTLVFSEASALESIYLKNGSSLTTINTSGSDNIQFVCADDDEVDFLTNYFSGQGITPNINSYCSFTPGGDYNTITGNTTFDLDNNGCDASNLVFPHLKLNIDDGTDTGSSFTTNSGEYNFYTQDGNFTITPEFENPTFFNATPIDAIINFTDANNNITTQDFCITANGVHNDVEIVMAPTIPARPGFDAEYIITYKNKGNQTLSGDFVFNYDDTVLDYISATEAPLTQTTGLLSWNYTNLFPFESRSVYVTLNVNSPQETPEVNIDDLLDFFLTINPVVGDEIPDDNTFGYKQTVVGSYDPNDITCLEGDIVEPTQIGEYLHYIINFENTGNFPAQNIVVATEIDPAMFDINTLRVLSSSHDAYVKVKGGIVEIVFEAIYLDTGGHGNILLKVQSQDTLQTNDTVTKNAEIFFDYNFPIETNNANTTYAVLSTTEFEIDHSVSVYPNPVKDVVIISAKDNIKSVALFDVSGRVLQTKITTSKELKLDLSSRASGVYFVKITTEKGIKVEKILKD